MKHSIRYSLLTLLAILCVGVALSASRLRLPAFSQSAGAATQQQAVTLANDADDPAEEMAPGPSRAGNAIVHTDKAKYAPGEVILIIGSGWDPGEAVTLLLREEPRIHSDRRVSVTADALGNIFDNQFVEDGDLDVTFYVTATGKSSGLTTKAAFGKASADLDQWANLDNAWVNGNLGASKAKYFEGDSIPYRLKFSGLTTGAPHTVTIQWDTLKSTKHALDYLTTLNRSVPHVPPAVPGEAIIDPCLGVSPAITCTYTPKAIAFEPNGPASQVPGEFRLYGSGTSASISLSNYTVDPSGDQPTSIAITFTPNVANPVLTWGGHIATRVDWGQTNSAISIPGSPYHTRLLDLDGSGGNQDRSLSADAVVFPATIKIFKHTDPPSTTSFGFTASGLSATSFSLADNSSSTDGLQTFNNIITFGSKTVSESNPLPGYKLTALSCTEDQSPNTTTSIVSGGAGGTASIGLEEGENVTCTFTNTQQGATLHVIKVVTNSFNGGKGVSDFSLHVKSGGTDVTGSPQNGTGTPGTLYNLNAGSYTVSEDAVTGYTGTISGACNATTGAVSLAAGEDKTCTITNQDIQPKLHVIKVVTNSFNGGKGVSDFSLHVKSGGTDVTGSPQNGTGTPGTLYNLNAGSYTVSEDAVTGYTGTISGACNATTGAVTLAAGEDKTCTITNQDIQPKLHVIKVVSGGSSVLSDFSLHVKSGGTDVTGSPQNGTGTPGTLYNLNAGSYTVSEDAVTGYTGTISGACNATTGAVTLAAGEDKTCTVTNTYAKASPAVTTVMSWTLKDEAIVTDIRRGAACGGPATVTFKLYRFDLTATDFSDCGAEGVTEIILQNPVVTLVYDDPADSSTTGRASISADVNTEGIYVWTAEYSGDECNNSKPAVCGKERTTITQVNNTP